MDVYIDLETWSELDIKQVGTYRYAENAEILLIAFAVDDEPVQVVESMDELPLKVRVAVRDCAATFIAHNSMFDRNVLRYRGYDIPVEHWEDTMVVALSAGYPGSLAEIGLALNLDQEKAKLDTGRELIKLFCTPHPNSDVYRPNKRTHPDEWAQFVAYAARDVDAMREIRRRLPRLNWTKTERELWYLDQAMNDRGFAVDLELARAGKAAADQEKAILEAQFQDITQSDLRPSQRAKVQNWMNVTFGLNIENTQSVTMERLYTDPAQPTLLREAAKIVTAYNRSSNAKYEKMLSAVNTDGRFRGGLQYNGASRTRRWAGRFFQPQNLPSRGLPAPRDVENYIEALKLGMHDLVEGDVMLFGAAAIRGLIIPSEGRSLLVSDLSNIEGRMCAWLADETWKLEAFREFDAGTGPDIYNVTAASIVGGDPWDLEKAIRNSFGKVPELALQFAAGAMGLQTFAQNYHTAFAPFWDTIQRNIDENTVEYAKRAYFERGLETGLPELEWVASECVKLAWRRRHPKIKALWNACEDAARSAIAEPNNWFRAGRKLRFRMSHKGKDQYLLVQLPSGRYLVYADPKIVKNRITYMGYGDEDSRGSRKWIRRAIHGGRCVAHATQATAGDIFRDALPKVVQAGIDPALLVHDEVVAEGAATQIAELNRLLAEGHPWSQGLPLAAAGKSMKRYRKE